MNFRNDSPYHTATLRKIAVTVFKAFGSQPGWPTKVQVITGRTRITTRFQAAPPAAARTSWTPSSVLFLSLPKLRGDEFIALLKQQHGGIPARYDGTVQYTGGEAVTTERVALAFQWAAEDYANRNTQRTATSPNLPVSVRLALVKAKLPVYVPLKPPKEEAPQEPRNIRQERYQRVLEMEARWQRKLKLAQTKLKKIRAKKKHYHKKLNINQETNAAREA